MSAIAKRVGRRIVQKVLQPIERKIERAAIKTAKRVKTAVVDFVNPPPIARRSRARASRGIAPSRLPRAMPSSSSYRTMSRPNSNFTNQMVRPGRNPVFSGTSRGVLVKHCELIGEIGGSQTFAIGATYQLNAGLPFTFPILSTITPAWERALYRRVRFRFESLVGSLSASQSVGEVMWAVEYDVHSAAFTSKIGLLNEEHSVSGSANRDLVLDIFNGTQGLLARNTEYLIRSGIPGGDVALYDPCVVTFATSNFASGAPAVVGNIWVEYEVELFQIKQPTSISRSYQMTTIDSIPGHSTLVPVATWLAATNNPIGPNTVLDVDHNANFLHATLPAVYIRKPDTYMLIYVATSSDAGNIFTLGGLTILDYTRSAMPSDYATYSVPNDSVLDLNAYNMSTFGGVANFDTGCNIGEQIIFIEQFIVSSPGYVQMYPMTATTGNIGVNIKIIPLNAGPTYGLDSSPTFTNRVARASQPSLSHHPSHLSTVHSSSLPLVEGDSFSPFPSPPPLSRYHQHSNCGSAALPARPGLAPGR
jgi:hypothetical protein